VAEEDDRDRKPGSGPAERAEQTEHLPEALDEILYRLRYPSRWD